MSELSTAPGDGALPRRTVAILAAACGIGVANVYFPQAVSPLIAAGLRVPSGSAALAVTAAQLGYAAGIFLLVPLGDRVRNRRLLTVLPVLTAVALLAAGTAPNLPVLIAAGFAGGATTVVPQIVIPMAAGLTPPERRGAVTGTLLSGLIGGILLARAFSGTLGQWLGWRAPYLVAASVMAVLAVGLHAVVPDVAPPSQASYPRLLAAPLRLFRDEPDLRRSCLYQACVFAGFSAAWTCLPLLVTGPRYHLGASVVGGIAVVGAASMLVTPHAGRMTDRRGPDRVSLLSIVGAAAAVAVLLAGSSGGVVGLVALAAGMLVLDVATQSGQVANQSRVLALHPDRRAQLNTAYMTSVFLGGSAGSWLGVRIWLRFGWGGVCVLVAAVCAVALVRHVAHMARRRAPEKERAVETETAQEEPAVSR